MAFFSWLKWIVWDTNVCKHEPGEWYHVNMGMQKVQPCKKCKKILDVT